MSRTNRARKASAKAAVDEDQVVEHDAQLPTASTEAFIVVVARRDLLGQNNR